MLDTGDGVGAVPVEDVVLELVLALALEPELELMLAELDPLAELVDVAPEKADAGFSHGLGEVEGVAVAEVVGVAVAVAVAVAVGVAVGVAVAVVVGVAVAEAVGVAVEVQKIGNPAGLLSADCSQLGSPAGNGFVMPDGSTNPGNGPGVAVGELDVVGVAVAVAAAGQVSASSRFWTCAWPPSVRTVAEACDSCAPANVATYACLRSDVNTMRNGELNETLRLRMAVKPPGTTKCHPSSCGATKPAQLPVVPKLSAVAGS